METNLHIILGGGATGGHVIPALNMGKEIKQRKPDARLTYLGAKDSLEERLAKAEKIPFRRVRTVFLRRSKSLMNLVVPFVAGFSVLHAALILLRERVDLVISTGGYSAWPSAAAARLIRKPYVLFEGNAYPGLVTRLLARRARRIYLASQEAIKHLKVDAGNVLVTGNPVRFDFLALNKEDARQKLGLDASRFTLFATGGSGGARSINKAVFDSRQTILERGYNLIWQVGKQWDGDINVPQEYSNRLVIDRFLDRDRMSTAMQAADMAVARCGAMTLSELAGFGLPAVVIPFPASTGGHQEANGREYENAGAGVMIMDADLTGETLLKTIENVNTEDRLMKMSSAMHRMARPEALKSIIDDIMEVIK